MMLLSAPRVVSKKSFHQLISYTATGHTHIKGNKHINDHSDNMWEHYTKTKAMVLVLGMEVAMGPGGVHHNLCHDLECH